MIEIKPQYPHLLKTAIETLNHWEDNEVEHAADWYTDLLVAVRNEMVAWEDGGDMAED